MKKSPLSPEKPVNAPLQPSFEELMVAYNELYKQKESLIEENKILKRRISFFEQNKTGVQQNQQDLLADISHTIQTPLDAIVGLTNNLKAVTDENTRNEHIAIIENAAFVLGDMISNIIETVEKNPGNTHVKLDIGPFNVKTLIHQLQTTFSRRLEGRPVEFITETDASLPDIVEGDEQKILNVLYSLLNNAEKFTRSGKIKLGVTVLKSFRDKLLAAFIIEDTGSELSRDNPGLFYERLEDYKNIRKELNSEGLGFGLPLTATSIKLLNGDIKIEKNSGINTRYGNITAEINEKKGLKITITLPLKKYKEKDISFEKNETGSHSLNTQILREFFGYDYSFAAEVYKIFINEAIPQINSWDELMQTKGAKELKARVHALKPITKMIGLNDLYGMCFDLEEQCSTETDDALLYKSIKKIKLTVEKIKPGILEQYHLINKRANKND